MMNKRKTFIFFLLIGISLFTSCGSSGDEQNTNQNTNSDSSRVEGLAEMSYEALCTCLDQYEVKKENSVNDCIEKYKSVIETLSENQADSLFQSVYVKLSNITAQVYPELDYQKDFDKSGNVLSTIEKKANEIGFFYDQEEGTYFYGVHLPYLEKYFKKVVSEKMKNYLKYKLENPDHIAFDAGLSIDWMDLAKRLNKQETILSNGDFIMIEDIASLFIMESHWLAHGMENTPAFDYETQEIYPEAHEAMLFLAKEGKPVLKQMFTDFLEEVEKNNGKEGKSIYELYGDKKLKKILNEKYKLKLK